MTPLWLPIAFALLIVVLVSAIAILVDRKERQR